VLLTKYYSGDKKFSKNEMGGECGTYGVEKRLLEA